MRAFVLLVLFLTPAAHAADVFFRAGAGFERSRDTAVGDVHCASTEPPALFGCGFGARGDFGDGPRFELAGGLGRGRTRLELALGHRSLELQADANFTNAGEDQPVRGDGSSLTAFVNGALDLGPASWRVRPFVTAGAGVARNRIGAVTYSFPALGTNAATIVRGGTHYDFAWNAGAGASLRLTSSFFFDLTVRYSDLGDVRTEAGEARIVRPNRELAIDIDATRTPLETMSAVVSLRYHRRR